MKNILVPTDFSENADNALNYAVELAEKAGGKVQLVHTYITTAHAGHLANIDRVVRVDRQKEMAAYLAKKNNSNIVGKLRNGEPVEMIEEEGERQEADLIVMGTLGANKLSKKLLGSTASNVIKNINIPVLAIPANVKKMDFDTLVVAFDALNIPAKEVMDKMLDFAKTVGLSLDLVHVSSDKLHTDLDSEIKDYLEKNKVDYSYNRVESNDTLEGILDYTQTKEKAILCLISRQRSWFSNLFHSSVSQKAAMQATMPLLVLHDTIDA